MMLAFLRGGGVKNWPNLLTDSSKKLPMEEGSGQKLWKNCQHLKWMVPNVGTIEVATAQIPCWWHLLRSFAVSLALARISSV